MFTSRAEHTVREDLRRSHALSFGSLHTEVRAMTETETGDLSVEDISKHKEPACKDGIFVC